MVGVEERMHRLSADRVPLEQTAVYHDLCLSSVCVCVCVDMGTGVGLGKRERERLPAMTCQCTEAFSNYMQHIWVCVTVCVLGGGGGGGEVGGEYGDVEKETERKK